MEKHLFLLFFILRGSLGPFPLPIMGESMISFLSLTKEKVWFLILPYPKRKFSLFTFLFPGGSHLPFNISEGSAYPYLSLSQEEVRTHSFPYHRRKPSSPPNPPHPLPYLGRGGTTLWELEC